MRLFLFAIKYTITFYWCTCLSNSNLTDRCYKLFDRPHRSPINTTLLQEKQWLILKSLLSQQTVAVGLSVSSEQAYPSHTCAHQHTQKFTGSHSSHTRIHEHKHLHTQIHKAWADKNAHIQKHPREGYSKWTSQPSKALTSIRHAFTVWLPTDGESHLSARASAKQFQSDRNHFMHICIYSMPNSLALFLITPTCAIYCNCVNCETICVFWMTLFSDGDFPTWNSCCTDTLS